MDYTHKYKKYKKKYIQLKDDLFWQAMGDYNRAVELDLKKDIDNFRQVNGYNYIMNLPLYTRIPFLKEYFDLSKKIRVLMFSDHTCKFFDKKTGRCYRSLYNVGADDGHEDLAKYILRNGKMTTETFIKNPKNDLIFALVKKMNSEGSIIDYFNADGQIDPRYLNELQFLKN